MDREADLIRSESWEELRKHYGGRVGYSWEAAWVSLLQLKDEKAAIRAFKEARRDPRFEEASSIMLWRLGQPINDDRALSSSTLKLYSAYVKGEIRPWVFHFKNKPKLLDYVDLVLERAFFTGAVVKKEEMAAIESLTELNSNAQLFMALLWDRRLRLKGKAKESFARYLKDPWVIKLLHESRRYLLDPEMSKRIQHAYAEKDGLMLQRLLKAQRAKLHKLKSAELPLVWRHALDEAVRVDSKGITENIRGFEFWENSEWSPLALHEMKKMIFPEGGREPLRFLKVWDDFFKSKKLSGIPEDLEPESRALWQIRVELQPSCLSKALLKFPTEERFLFLWSVEFGDRAQSKDDRQWPAQAKESSVVRESLKKAFQRSSNKLLWFNRLRQVGCSQDFYEYALQSIDLPLQWILEDIENNFLRNSSVVRQVITDRVSVVSGNEADDEKLSVDDLNRAFVQLTPSEKQSALLSRFVLDEIPQDILDDDTIDLLWEARPRIGEEVEKKWIESIGLFLSGKEPSQFGLRHWRWVYLCWQADAKWLGKFSPQLGQTGNFPWSSYLEAADSHGLRDLVLTCLPRLRDDRLRMKWIEQLLESQERDHRLYQSIQAIETPHVKLSLLALWHEEKSELEKAFVLRKEQLEETPVLNETGPVYRQMFSLIQQMPENIQSKYIDELPAMIEGLQSLGLCDFSFMQDCSMLAERHGAWDRAWQWALQEWMMSPEQERYEQIERLLDLAFRARRVDEAQRLLVDLLFLNAKPTQLSAKILDQLLDEKSVFRLKHLRPEFVQKVGGLFPLREEVLKKRAASDYRAVLLWDCFLGAPLEEAVIPPELSKKRKFDLWGMTEALTQRESFAHFANYLEPRLAELPQESESHDYKDSALRLMHRLFKQYRLKVKPDLFLKKNQSTALLISFEPAVMSLDVDFFQDLDEEIWLALATGYVQAFSDWQRGLFDNRSLSERFFQALLLSGCSIKKVVRACVWIALFEKLIDREDLSLSGQELVNKLPFLNQLLILYLSEDYSRKIKECGLRLR